jgi:2,4-dienoyl-CoA reductase-like NADH-dependent reductase (Old Yellow Enzyme family)
VTRYPRIGGFRSAAALRARCTALGIALPCDEAAVAAPESPLAQPLDVGGTRLANRFAIQPMEGWDGTDDGRPTPLTERRWRRFGGSGAALVWGGEAVAVRADGRANPNQLLLADATAAALGGLRRILLAAAAAAGNPPPLLGLQLTHSGRWARTAAGPAPRIAFRHPLLDRRVGVGNDAAVLADVEVDELVGDFARAARLAQAEGFDFVDIKHCHGYLLHEFLAARGRGGRFGGRALAARTRLLFAILDAVREAAPGLAVGVRLSIFDVVPHRPGADGVGVAETAPLPYDCAFGLDPAAPARLDLDEPIAVVRALAARGVRLLNVTGASPYYAPHAQRPAACPPSDGYRPPEDPLVGVARLLDAARRVKAAVPEAIVVSSGWSYLQDWLPHAAQATVRAGWFDAVGLGRMALSYPELPGDVLAGRPLDRRRICRTFSECTTAPRQGRVSGCYPLDPFYRARRG